MDPRCVRGGETVRHQGHVQNHRMYSGSTVYIFNRLISRLYQRHKVGRMILCGSVRRCGEKWKILVYLCSFRGPWDPNLPFILVWALWIPPSCPLGHTRRSMGSFRITDVLIYPATDHRGDVRFHRVACAGIVGKWCHSRLSVAGICGFVLDNSGSALYCTPTAVGTSESTECYMAIKCTVRGRLWSMCSSKVANDVVIQWAQNYSPNTTRQLWTLHLQRNGSGEWIALESGARTSELAGCFTATAMYVE